MKKGIFVILVFVLILFSAYPAFAVGTVTDQTYGNLYERFNDLRDVDLGVAAPSLAKAVDAGIFRGDTSGSLRPFSPTKGTELVIVMLRVLGLENGSGNEIKIAIDTGLLTQDDPILTGGLTREVTRVEALVFIAKALNIQPDYGTSPFSDSSDPYITALYNQGLVKGYGDGTVGYDRPLTRAELAILIDRMLDSL